MIETRVLTYYCKKCGIQNHPYGDSRRELPHSADLKCNKCGYIANIEWLDVKSESLRYKNTTKQDKEIKLQIEVLEAKQISNTKEIELLREKLAMLINIEIKDLKDKSGDYQYNMNVLQSQITKLQETFDKIREHQKNNTRNPENER